MVHTNGYEHMTAATSHKHNLILMIDDWTNCIARQMSLVSNSVDMIDLTFTGLGLN